MPIPTGGSAYGGTPYGAPAYSGPSLSTANVVIDRLYLGRNGQPALVPAPVYGVAPIPPSDSRWVLAGGWSSVNGAVSTVGATATFTYVGVACNLVLTANFSGGIIWVTLDGSPRLAMDCYRPVGPPPGPIEQELLSPQGGQHTVTLTWYGDVSGREPLTSVPTNGVGTSVTPNITLQRVNRTATTLTNWTVTALDASHVSINGSGSYALGSTVTGVIAGFNLVLGNFALTAGDTSTFNTQQIVTTLVGAYVALTSSSAAVWTSPLIGADNTATVPGSGGTQPTVYPLPLPDVSTRLEPIQWVAACWEENPAVPITTGTAATGNSQQPATDAAWAIAPFGLPNGLAVTHWTDDAGVGHGCVGLAVLPSGGYCQLSFSIPTGGFLRALRLYGWNPDDDGHAARWAALQPMADDAMGQRLWAALTLNSIYALRDPWREQLSSYSPGAAVGPLLDGRGAEWGLRRPYGEDDSDYAALLRFLSASRTNGATMAFINQALSLLLGPSAVFSVVALGGSTTQWTLGTSLLGIDTTLGVVNLGTLQAVITLQVSTLRLPPQLIQQIIAAFTTIGVTVSYVWN